MPRRGAELVAALEVQLSTDFALLYAGQGDRAVELDSGVYAVSAPGVASLRAGTKYAELDVRVERWTAVPPLAGEEWEDQDVLPWQSVEGGGPVEVSGFDPVESEGLAVDELARGRLEVLAWGRDRYSYGGGPADDECTIPRERWLLRLWPDPDVLDAMAGPPRRLVGREWLPPRRNGWQAAVHALQETGWRWALSDVPGFKAILETVRAQRGAFRAEDLVPPDGRWNWDTTLNATRTRLRRDRQERGLAEAAELGQAAGVEVVNYRDALQALIRLGVLATVATPTDALLVANPSPPLAAWDVLELSAGARIEALNDYRALAEDVQHLARWAGGGVLHATPQRIASRLAVPVEEVLGALRLLDAHGCSVDRAPEGIGADTEIALSTK